jgi:hypothetical protein
VPDPSHTTGVGTTAGRGIRDGFSLRPPPETPRPARAGRGIPEQVRGILLCAWERCPGGALRIAASRGKVGRIVRSKATIRAFRWRPREAVHTVDWQ